MLTLSDAAAVLSAVGRARSVDLGAYVLRRDASAALIAALAAAGDRDASVRVRLQGDIFGDDGSLRAENEAVAADLRRHHVDAALNDGPNPLHMKAAVVDGTVYFDDRNWPLEGRSTVVVSEDAGDVAAAEAALHGHPARGPDVVTRKSDALAAETRMLYGAGAGDIDCESESFSFSDVYGALKNKAEHGAHVRLLVAARDAAGARSQRALAKLQHAGVEVRVGPDDEKLAIAGGEAWLGSANATDGRQATIDWGARTHDPKLVAALRRRFAQNWSRGHAFRAAGPA
jgi:hypothetical protein